MKGMLKLAALLLSCASLLLGRCVAFEQSPVAELRCDPALPGRWLPLTDGKDGAIPMPVAGGAAVIDANCNVTLHDRNVAHPPPPFSAYGFSHGGMHYVVMRPADMQRVLGEHDPAYQLSDLFPPDAIFLLQYQIDADTMSLNALSPEKIKALLESGQVRGRTVQPNLHLLEGNARQLRRLLGRRGDWRTSGIGVTLMQFRRATKEEAVQMSDGPQS